MIKRLEVLLSSGGITQVMDAIDYEGGIWLVPEWLDIPEQRVTKPVRIVRVDVLPHDDRRTDGGGYSIRRPIPRSVLDGEVTFVEGRQYIVHEAPDIVFRTDVH